MKRMNNKEGFTLIELLLVVMIIGFMLAVILPRGLRATTDAKYNLVRQNASELASFANDWIEQQILAQDATSTATRAQYLLTLVDTGAGGTSAAWIADSTDSNWNNNGSARIVVAGRIMGGIAGPAPQLPENTVEEIIEPAKIPRNPFNGGSVFLNGPNEPQTAVPGTPIPGALAAAVALDVSTGGSFDYYGLVFQGTDSTLSDVDPNSADFHGGMNTGYANLAGVREGVFFTKVRNTAVVPAP